jgi:16S rRNA (uracil1498-N3)-methyltransferase
MDWSVIPYENAEGINATRESLESLRDCKSAAIFIGPEGGYESSEINLAKEENIIPISLGRRILRTETAGLALLSMIMLYLED